MNLRAASLLTLLSVPVSAVLFKFFNSPAMAWVVLALVSCGLLLAIVTCKLAAQRDRTSQARAIFGIVINAPYLGVLVYMMFFR